MKAALAAKKFWENVKLLGALEAHRPSSSSSTLSVTSAAETSTCIDEVLVRPSTSVDYSKAQPNTSSSVIGIGLNSESQVRHTRDRTKISKRPCQRL